MYRHIIALLAICAFFAFSGLLSVPDAIARPQPHLKELYNSPSELNKAVSAILRWRVLDILHWRMSGNTVEPPKPSSGSFADLLDTHMLPEELSATIKQLTHCENLRAIQFTISSADDYSITIDGRQCDPKRTKPILSIDGNTIFLKAPLTK